MARTRKCDQFTTCKDCGDKHLLEQVSSHGCKALKPGSTEDMLRRSDAGSRNHSARPLKGEREYLKHEVLDHRSVSMVVPRLEWEARALALVTKRRVENFEKHGVQDLDPEHWLRLIMEEVGELARALNEHESGGRFIEELRDTGALCTMAIASMCRRALNEREAKQDADEDTRDELREGSGDATSGSGDQSADVS